MPEAPFTVGRRYRSWRSTRSILVERCREAAVRSTTVLSRSRSGRPRSRDQHEQSSRGAAPKIRSFCTTRRGLIDRCLPAARSRARSACASNSRHATHQRSGGQHMRAKRRVPITCRHSRWRKEPLRSDQRSGRARGAVSRRVLASWQGQFQGQFGPAQCFRNSKHAVYFAFLPR